MNKSNLKNLSFSVSLALSAMSATCSASPAAFAPESSESQGYLAMSENSDEKHLDIYIYGVIGWEVTSRNLVRQLNEYENLKTIKVHLNTVGGIIGEGLAMLNTLRKHDAEVTCDVDGYALSMGSIIMLAGKTRIARNSLIMIHRAQGGEWGDAGELRKEADVLEKHEKALIAEYVAKTGLSEEKIQKMLDAETWFTAEEALEIGLVDEIIDPVDLDEVDEQISQNVWDDINKMGLKNMKTQFKSRVARKVKSPAALRGSLASASAGGNGDAPASSAGGDPAPVIVGAGNASGTVSQSDLATDQAQWQETENQRRVDITAVFAAHGGVTGQYADLAQAALNDMNITPDKAREMLLDKMGEQSPGAVAAGSSVIITEDQVDKTRSAMSNALLGRSNVVTMEQGNPFAHASLMDIARECLANAGVSNASSMDKRNMVGMAFTQTSSDFPVILERTIHEAVLIAYKRKANVWKQFCRTGSVSDFRDHDRLHLGSFGNLDEVNEAGELKHKNIPDGATEKVSIGTKGNLISITRKAIINDDIGYFMKMSDMLGVAAGRSIEADVFKLLASNPKLADGKALFHADHNNLHDGSAMSADTLDAMRIKMGKQKDISKNDFLDISPALLLTSLEMGGTAREIMQAEKRTLKVGNVDTEVPNKVRDMADVIDTARLSGNAYYLFADPQEAAAIEVNFLDGVEEPFLDQEEGWNIDGTQLKVRLDYGVNATDYRGVQRNPGA